MHVRPTKGNVFFRNGNPLGEQPMNYWQPAIVALRATYLPAYKAAVIYVPIRHLYICREASTNRTFLCKTNPILSAVGGLQMNVNFYLTKDYNNEQRTMNNERLCKTNPIQTQSCPPLEGLSAVGGLQMNVNSLITKDYNNEQRTTNNERLCKTNPIKANFKPAQIPQIYSQL